MRAGLFIDWSVGVLACSFACSFVGGCAPNAAVVDASVDPLPEVVDARAAPVCQLRTRAFASASGTPTETGGFSLLTYNVAGLPAGISAATPEIDNALISPLLNNFDIVLVQENFFYDRDLASQVTLPFRSFPFVISSLGDGLATFSNFALSGCEHRAWERCSGTLNQGSGADCLTPKGFAVVTYELAAGVHLDIYNLHNDAGPDESDIAARQAQIEQLAAFAEARGADRAIIVAGDTNTGSRDETNTQRLLTTLGLTDVCRELACPEPNRIDRVMYRNGTLQPGGQITLSPTRWYLDQRFVDDAGEPLSDHLAVATEFTWSFVSAQ